MKRFLMAALLGCAAVSSHADYAMFGALSFDSPQGAKAQVSPLWMSFTLRQGDRSATVTVFRHRIAKGSATEDFREEWQSRVKEDLKVSAEPKVESLEMPNAWTRTVGFAREQSQGRSVALTVFSGRGVRASVRAVSDDPKLAVWDAPFFSAFLGSVRPLTEPRAPADRILLPSSFSVAVPDGFLPYGAWFRKKLPEAGSFKDRWVQFTFLDPFWAPKEGWAALTRMVTLPKEQLPAWYRELMGNPLLGDMPFPDLFLFRAVGPGFPTAVLCAVKEQGPLTKRLFSLHLIDLGHMWQPLLVVETVEGGLAGQGAVEELLAAVRVPGWSVKAPSIPRELLVGEYGFGKAGLKPGDFWMPSSLKVVGVSPASRSGSLRLSADGSYVWAEEGKGEESGRWAVEADLLVLTPGSGSPRKLRVAAAGQPASWVKYLMLLDRSVLPVSLQAIRNLDNVFFALSKK
ncbi:MAG: hypothetical protein WHU10_02110 [Fimbriimonadales bacterium]